MHPDKKKPFIVKPIARHLALTVAGVAGVFSLIVCILLIANYLQIKALDPINQPELLSLRKQISEMSEADPAMVEQLRVMDLLARKAFFTSQAHLRMGGQLLLAGMTIFLIALKLASVWSPRIPMPEEERPSDQSWKERSRAREWIAFLGVALAAAALLAAYFTPLDFPVDTMADLEEHLESDLAPESTAVAFPDWNALQQQWPSFRGPGGFGVAYHVTAPTDWDGASGRNIRWKAEIPLPGFNSPVVWDQSVWVSGANADVREVYCYDADTGALRWKQTLPTFPGTPDQPPKTAEDTGFAAATMAVHGEYVFAIFANGDLACYDLSGKMQWGRNLGEPDNHYGHASSLIAWERLLFVQYDDRKKPRLIAVQADTGEEAWVAERKKISWASPICAPMDSGTQLILASERDADAYDPLTGRLLWTVNCLGGEVAPSPAYVQGTILVANEYATAAAIRVEEINGAVKAEVVWKYDEYLPEVSSPVGAGGHFYFGTSRGELICLDIASGEEVWMEEFDEGFYSSPILVGDRIYLLDREGTMQIFKTGAEYESLGTPALDEAGNATPAFMDNRIYIRTDNHLWCIENPA